MLSKPLKESLMNSLEDLLGPVAPFTGVDMLIISRGVQPAAVSDAYAPKMFGYHARTKGSINRIDSII